MTQRARTTHPVQRSVPRWMQEWDAHAATVKGDAVAQARLAADRITAQLDAATKPAEPLPPPAILTPAPPTPDPVVPQNLSLWRALFGATLTILRKVWP